MENKAFKETEAGTELHQVTINGNVKATTTCTPQVCRSARQRYQPPDLANNSPWNQKKTYFFIGVISLLVVWIIVYTVVSELKLVWRKVSIQWTWLENACFLLIKPMHNATVLINFIDQVSIQNIKLVKVHGEKRSISVDKLNLATEGVNAKLPDWR